MFTGGDTTVAAIAATFFYLSRSPAAFAKVSQELRMALATLDSIRQGSILTSCTYLRACLDEVMRLSPPAPGTLVSSTSTLLPTFLSYLPIPVLC